MDRIFRNGLNGLSDKDLRNALAAKRATKAAFRAQSFATSKKIKESRLLTKYLEESEAELQQTIEAVDLQLLAIQQHMQMVNVHEVDLGQPGIPPSPSNETREMLLQHIDDQIAIDPEPCSDEEVEGEGSGCDD